MMARALHPVLIAFTIASCTSPEYSSPSATRQPKAADGKKVGNSTPRLPLKEPSAMHNQPRLPSFHQSDHPNPALPPNERILGSTISVPHEVTSGHALNGQVPVGSQVKINEHQVVVDASGHFSYQVPHSASGSLQVRIGRPAPDPRPPMTIMVVIRD